VLKKHEVAVQYYEIHEIHEKIYECFERSHISWKNCGLQRNSDVLADQSGPAEITRESTGRFLQSSAQKCGMV